MTRPAYVLTRAAETDLRGIIRRTRGEWGDAQVHRYITRLGQGMSRLAAGKGSFREMSEIYPTLRMAHCEHHCVFCLPRERVPALIMAILHERMDLMVRLAERL